MVKSLKSNTFSWYCNLLFRSYFGLIFSRLLKVNPEHLYHQHSTTFLSVKQNPDQLRSGFLLEIHFDKIHFDNIMMYECLVFL